MTGEKTRFPLSPDLQAAMRRFIELGDLTSQLAKVIQEASVRLPKIDLSHLQFGATSWFDEIGKRFKNNAKAQKLLDAGWVPYAGMPIDQFDSNDPEEDASNFASSLLDGHWDEVRQALLLTVEQSGADDEAIATYVEGLSAFETGHYRSVVRLLFPEIERVARETIYGGSRKDWSFADNAEKRGLNTGLSGLRDALTKHLPAGLATHADFGFALTEKMDAHLYRYVGSDDDSLTVCRADPVPNRHASQHGYVIYASRQNAFNALSMSAFMFDVVMRVSRYLERSTEDT